MKWVRFTAFTLTFALSACATGTKIDKKLLSEVESVAVVSVTYDRRIQGGASKNPLQQLRQLKKMVGVYDAPTETEATFYNTLNDDAMDILNEEAPFKILAATEVIKNETYLSLIDNKPGRYYAPSPYSFIGSVDTKTAQKLCKALNVDAVMIVKYVFIESSKQVIFKNENSRSLRSDFELINRNGQIVLEGKSSSESVVYASGIAISGVHIDEEQLGIYEDIAASYLGNFELDIKNAKAFK